MSVWHLGPKSRLSRHGNWPQIRRFPLGKKKKPAPKNKMVRSNWNGMVLHQVKNWQNWKMQGCFMQFLGLIFVKKLQLQLHPLTPTGGIAPWTSTGGLLRPPGPHFSADFSILSSHACWVIQWSDNSCPSGYPEWCQMLLCQCLGWVVWC